MTKSIALALLHQGLVRSHNEDNLFLLDSAVPVSKTGNYERSAASSEPLQFYAVADGMGGRGIGDLAAFTSMRVLDQQSRHVKPGSRFDFDERSPAGGRLLSRCGAQEPAQGTAGSSGQCRRSLPGSRLF